jgi:hypothetical protein
MYPEFLFWMPTVWSVMFLFWGQASAKWRAMYPPPLFPKRVDDKPIIRPQADLEDLVLDESPPVAGEAEPAAAAVPADPAAAADKPTT